MAEYTLGKTCLILFLQLKKIEIPKKYPTGSIVESFSSHYKFALLIILKRLAIEKWQDTRIT